MQANTFLIFLLFVTTSLFGQTLPGINQNTEAAIPSYTLLDAQNRTFLLNNCGDVVHQWNTYNMRHHSKLLPDGSILFIQYDYVYKLNWEGDIIENFTDNDASIELEYEIIVLPNGNYLCVGRKHFSTQDFIDIGYEFSAGESPSQVDVVVELDKDTGNIVWEWVISDHVIQERDPNAPNYGVLKDNPQLLNTDAITTFDWQYKESFMINGMDYNPALDQIILSVRKINEMIIIDHSTTTAEAAGHTGGNSGKGGDILWRWGNPANYDSGTEEDHYLFFQHNTKWITKGPHLGKISCYNNGLGRPNTPFDELYSTIPLIVPQIDADGHYMRDENGAFLPQSPEISYDIHNTDTKFYSGYTSGAEFLSNGNVYVTEGQTGRLFEFNSEGEKVWEYTNPTGGYIFRSEKYPLSYAAFEGRDLTPSGPIPGGDNGYDCNIIISNTNVDKVINYFDIQKLSGQSYSIINQLGGGLIYQLYNMQGAILFEGKTNAPEQEIDLSDFPSGYYVVHVADKKLLQWKSYKLFNE